MNNPVRRNRVLKAIDGDRSYIQTYHRDDTQDFVLFIHGILGHHRETWKDTPAQLRAHLATYRRIYVIAHSMGGLVTGEACALLARAQRHEGA